MQNRFQLAKISPKNASFKSEISSTVVLAKHVAHANIIVDMTLTATVILKIIEKMRKKNFHF